MILTSIEIFGFKSFGKKIRIDFDGRVTGIVGPNGSGKSNIVDAIKWALGEQRVKSLRGGRMEDVIFSGTQTRRPLGYAQVTLTLNNSGRIFHIDYDEIAITRRLFRSGESEYFINKAACRLKDIQTLLMDTGLSREGYSIIGQGQIESIVNNSPMERKLLLEEACGIVKFKSRKSDAEKKLALASSNLYRITDILNELQSRLPQLKKQSEKAEVYLSLRNELREIEINIFVSRMELLLSQLSKANADKQAIAESIAALGSEIEQLTQTVEAQKRELAEADSALEQQNGELKAVSEQLEQTNSEILVKSARIESLSTQIESARADIAEFRSAMEKYTAEDAGLRLKLGLSRQLLAQRTAEYAARREELVCVNEKYGESDELLRARSARLSEVEEQLLLSQTKHSELISQKLNAEFIVRTLKSEQNELSARLSQLGENEELNRLKESCAQAAQAYNQAARSANDAQTAAEACRERLANVFAELQSDEAKLKMLVGYDEGMQGYKYAVRKLAELKRTDSRFADSLLGAVGELITTEAKYAEAITKALGGAIEYIVTTDERAATAAIAELKRGSYGRVTFLPKNIIRAYGSVDTRSLREMRGFLGEASELIGYDAAYEQIVKNLLSRTMIIDNIDNANLIAKKTGYKYKLVTLDGEVLMSGGAMVGGRTKNDDEGVLKRKSEIKELGERVASLRKEYDELVDSRAKLNEARELARAEAERLKTEYEQIKNDYTECGLADRHDNMLRVQLQNELAQKARALEEAAEKAERLKSEITAQEELADNLTAELNELKAASEVYASGEYKAEYSEAMSAHSAAEIAKMKAAEEVRLLMSNLANLTEKSRETLFMQFAKNASIRQLEAQIIELNASLRELNGAKAVLSESAQQLESDYRVGAEARAVLAKRLSEGNERIISAGAERSRVSERLAGAESAVTRLTVESEHLQRDMLEDYSLSYAEALERAGTGSVNLTGGLQRIGELKERIKKLGNINVEAPEEYRELKDRFEDMCAQRDDLISSRDELNKIIDDISANMQKQFLREFEVIQKEFSRVFAQLFSGGEAKLMLTDPDDIAASGVDIMAQPPKTKLKNINSLSGGEKSMTAISLIFAILNVKPSPFTVLDEIDAALDDANVIRISDYLTDIDNQFIVITHKKRTMEAADVLYGASMGADGITRLLSVRMSDINEKGEINAG